MLNALLRFREEKVLQQPPLMGRDGEAIKEKEGKYLWKREVTDLKSQAGGNGENLG